MIPGASKESAANLIRTGKLVVSRLYSARGKLIESVSSPSEELPGFFATEYHWLLQHGGECPYGHGVDGLQE